MALNANHLVTLSEQRIWMGVQVATVQPDVDSLLEICINGASSMIEAFLDRLLISQTKTLQYDGNRTDTLFLGDWPVTSVASIYNSTSWEWVPANLIDPAEYRITDNQLFVQLNKRSFDFGRANIQVTFTAGYDSPATPASNPLPSAIKHAAYMLTDWLYTIRGDRRIGVANKAKSAESISFIDGIPLPISEILEPYKKDFFIPDTAPIKLR